MSWVKLDTRAVRPKCPKHIIFHRPSALRQQRAYTVVDDNDKHPLHSASSWRELPFLVIRPMLPAETDRCLVLAASSGHRRGISVVSRAKCAPRSNTSRRRCRKGTGSLGLTISPTGCNGYDPDPAASITNGIDDVTTGCRRYGPDPAASIPNGIDDDTTGCSGFGPDPAAPITNGIDDVTTFYTVRPNRVSGCWIWLGMTS